VRARAKTPARNLARIMRSIAPRVGAASCACVTHQRRSCAPPRLAAQAAQKKKKNEMAAASAVESEISASGISDNMAPQQWHGVSGIGGSGAACHGAGGGSETERVGNKHRGIAALNGAWRISSWRNNENGGEISAWQRRRIINGISGSQQRLASRRRIAPRATVKAYQARDAVILALRQRAWRQRRHGMA
jgi:hypothetical protein